MVVAPVDHPEPRVTSCKSLYTINEPRKGIVLLQRELFCPPYDGDALHQIEHRQSDELKQQMKSDKCRNLEIVYKTYIYKL